MDQSEFSGWKVNATTVIRDYDSLCTRMYLTRDGISACAYNNGTVPTAWITHTLPSGMASNKMCDLDIDGNSTVAAATDGVLLLRYLLGLRDTAFIADVPISDVPRNTATLIEQFIASKRFDLDGDNATSNYIEGLLAVRLMSGLTCNASAARRHRQACSPLARRLARWRWGADGSAFCRRDSAKTSLHAWGRCSRQRRSHSEWLKANRASPLDVGFHLVFLLQLLHKFFRRQRFVEQRNLPLH